MKEKEKWWNWDSRQRSGSGPGLGRCFPVFPKVDTPYGQALTGLRVDGPLGRRFLRGLSLTRLWREGCCRAPLNYRRRPLMKKPLQPPCGRGKTGQPRSARGNAIPLWWLAPPPFPLFEGAQQPVLTVEILMKRMFSGVLFCPLNRGQSGEAGKGVASAASQSAECFSCHMTLKGKSVTLTS